MHRHCTFSFWSFSGFLALLSVLLVQPAHTLADEKGWIPLTGPQNLGSWAGSLEGWILTSDVKLQTDNPRLLQAGTDKGDILVNGPKGRTRNLVTKQKFTDLEVHVEFLVSKGSNAGVKLMGLYEIQIYDSFGRKELTGSDCGGVYPRGEHKPRYHTIDKGVPPRTNAARPAGEWQTLDMVFRAPRFDAEGKKTTNARFLKVTLNGQVIHENVELLYPTGAAWRLAKEVPTGPLLLQADHGPVAFRNVRVRPIAEK